MLFFKTMAEYSLLKSFDSLDEYDGYLKNIPQYRNRSRKCIQCKSCKHTRGIQNVNYETEDCNVSYKFVACKFEKKFEICRKSEHNHTGNIEH